MKCIVALLAAFAAWNPQSTVETHTYDVNGSPVEGVTTVRSNGSTSQITRNLNGRTVPVQNIEERVVSDAGGFRIVERTIRRYGPNGNPGPAEHVRVEEQKHPDGSIRTSTIVSQGNINGAFQVTERSTGLSRVTGERTHVATTVERPTLNGSMELVERREQAVVAAADTTSDEETTYRRDSNGRFVEVSRTSRERQTQDGRVNETVAEYETANTGEMRIMRRSVARVDPAGSRVVTIYLPDPKGEMALFKQQQIERKETSSGAAESTMIRVALPGAFTKLGPARKAEETVCTGVCGKKPLAVAEAHQPTQTK